ncbi:hypothetical protein KKD52_07745 [Myxococcota bacterium]|nr:hypothetical protein [Myxococcota bacterium]MBU1412299.1 hypothetical protein [Myxococcota bacterium]MBU1510241.1 hypothetical protein [Myxococcota bacterium]
MDREKRKLLKDLFLAIHHRNPAETLRILNGLLADPEHPDELPLARSRRADRHRQWVASLGFSSISGLRLSTSPRFEPLRMPLGLSLEYLFKDWGIHLMLFPMDFAPDGPAPSQDTMLPSSQSAIALGAQVGILKRSGDTPLTFGLDVRFRPTAREAVLELPKKRFRLPGSWQVTGFTGYHFPLLDFN